MTDDVCCDPLLWWAHRQGGFCGLLFILTLDVLTLKGLTLKSLIPSIPAPPSVLVSSSVPPPPLSC